MSDGPPRRLRIIHPTTMLDQTVTGFFKTDIPLPMRNALGGAATAPMIIVTRPGRLGVTSIPAFSGIIIHQCSLVLDADTLAVLYNPRDFLGGMLPLWRTWLDLHPEWPERKLREIG